ncbi:Acyl carrier protein [Dirofilaria immitis]
MSNKADLMATYFFIALLCSLYKEMCDERIIRYCYKAMERARKYDHVNLSESQFNEVQQPSDLKSNRNLKTLKSTNTRYYEPKFKLSGICAITENLDNLGTENIDQGTDVIIEFLAKTTATRVTTDANFDDTLGQNKYNGKRISHRTIVVKDYAEMDLSHDYKPS